MIFKFQQTTFYIIAVIGFALILTGCENRPAGESWKFASHDPQIESNHESFSLEIDLEKDGSLSDQQFKHIHGFLEIYGQKRGDILEFVSSDMSRDQESAHLIGYWLQARGYPGTFKQVTNKGINKGALLKLHRIRLSLSECATQMHQEITTLNSITKPVHGCANRANLIHMISNPRHYVEGSDPGFMDGEYAAQKIDALRAGEKQDLIIDQLDAVENSERE